MKNIKYLILSLLLLSCQDQNTDNSLIGALTSDDVKSELIVKLADSYLSGNFDIARDYLAPDGKHYFNNLEFDVDGIIDGYNSHSLIFTDIKHNDRRVYTGYFNDGSVETFQDFNWSATSIITGKEYNYPGHCRWLWVEDKVVSTTCYVDPTAILEESAIYAENQN